MTMPTDEQRLETLEIKLAFTEDLLEQLNLTVFRQQERIDALLRDLQELRQRMPEAAPGARAPRDERPPHY